MIKEFIVSRIEASQDGTPYVNVSFIDQTAAETTVNESFWGQDNDIHFPGRVDEELTKSYVKCYGSWNGVR